MKSPTAAEPIRREDAQGMLEFALILPLLLLLILGVIEMGRMLFIFSATTAASREAARYGAAVGSGTGGIAHYRDCAGMRAAAARIGNLAGIQDSDVIITYDNPDDPAFTSLGLDCPVGGTGESWDGVGARVVVNVTAHYSPIVPLIPGLGDGFDIQTVSSRTIIKGVVVGSILGTGTGSPAPVVVISFVSPDSMVTEDVGTTAIPVVITQITGGTAVSNTLTVPFTFIDGSAKKGVDYTGVSGAITFQVGDTVGTVRTINVPITDDTAIECNENFQVKIGTPVGGTLGSYTIHNVTILDNDDPFIRVSNGVPPSIREDYSPGSTFTVELVDSAGNLAPSGQNVQIGFGLGGTAVAGVDYTFSSPGIFSVPICTSSATVQVIPLIDGLDEDNETVILSLASLGNAQAGSPATGQLIIEDIDDPPNIFFQYESQSTKEVNTTLPVRVMLDAISGRTVTLSYDHAGSTATKGADFLISPDSPGSISIPAGSLSADINVTIIEDGLNTEPDETIRVAMTGVSGAIITSPNEHIINITNKTVYFADSPAARVVTETVSGELLTIPVTLNTPATEQVTVPFAFSGTAARNADFTLISPTATNLVFSPGEQVKNIQVRINDDPLDEDDETVEITLVEPTINAARVDPYQYIILIKDNDLPPAVRFSSTAVSLLEADTVVTVTIELYDPVTLLPIPSGRNVSVPFTRSGTALVYSNPFWDFSISPPSPLVIPAGSPRGNIILTLKEDLYYELDETVILTLDTPLNAALGTPSVNTTTILNDDGVPVISFEFDSIGNVLESAGSIPVKVLLSNPAGVPVSVAFTNTATSNPAYTPVIGSDFLINPGSLSIPPGEAFSIVHLDIISDTVPEADERVILTMDPGSVVNAAPESNPETFEVVIVDDDEGQCDNIYSLVNPDLDPLHYATTIRVDLPSLNETGVYIRTISVSWVATKQADKLALNKIYLQSNEIWAGPSTVIGSMMHTWTEPGNRQLVDGDNVLDFDFTVLGGTPALASVSNLYIELSNDCIVRP